MMKAILRVVLVIVMIDAIMALVLPPPLRQQAFQSGDRTLQVSLYQGPVTLGDVSMNIKLLEQQATTARQNGSQLIMFPELYLQGYTMFDPAIIRKIAEPKDGPAFQAISTIAKRLGIAILYGYGEKDPVNPSIIYDSAQLVDATGASLLNHRKVQLAVGEDIYFTPGTKFGPVVNVAGINIGVLICFEVSIPEVSRELALQKAEMLLIPTANGMPPGMNYIAYQQVPTRATENDVYVAYCNFAQSNGTFPFYGMSVLASPSGQLLLNGPAGASGSVLLTTTLTFKGTGPQCTENILSVRKPAFWPDVCDIHAYCLPQ